MFRGAGLVTIRPSRPRNPRLSINLPFPRAGKAHLLRDRERPTAKTTPQETAPGGALSRRSRVNHRDDERKQKSLPGPCPSEDCTRRRERATLPTPVSLGKRPTDPLPGTQGSPAGSQPLSSTLGALAPAPTHFRVQPPTSPSLPLLLPLPEPRRLHSHGTRQPRAASKPPGETGARPCADHCACVRTRLCACSVSSPCSLGDPSYAPNPLLRVFAVVWWPTVIELDEPLQEISPGNGGGWGGET